MTGPQAGKAAVSAYDGKDVIGLVTCDPSDSDPSSWLSSTPKSLRNKERERRNDEGRKAEKPHAPCLESFKSQ